MGRRRTDVVTSIGSPLVAQISSGLSITPFGHAKRNRLSEVPLR